jgi:hypothetical protein
MSWLTVGDLIEALVGDDGFYSDDKVKINGSVMVVSRRGQTIGAVDFGRCTVEKNTFEVERLVCGRDTQTNRRGVEL